MQIFSRNRRICWLVVAIFVFGIYSVWLGQDCWWDLLNYHLYNPFSFLQGTWGNFTMAAGAHSFLNPLPDLYYYFFFTVFFEHPFLVAFFAGVPAGIFLWLVGCISANILAQIEYYKKNRSFLVFLIVLLTATAVGVSCQIGINSNEILLGNFVLASFWLLCLFVKDPETQFKKIGWAAFICGAATGMKLTVAPFCIALLAGYLLQWKRLNRPFKGLCIFALSGLAGFLVTDGYFMWKLYAQYGNPIFPYYNDIFHSPYFESIYLTDTRHIPPTWTHYLFYPFYWAFQLSPYAAEEHALFRDMRLALGYLAVIGLAVQWLRKKGEIPVNPLVKTIIIYTMISYVLWLFSFPIIRYAVVLEFLVVLLCFVLFLTISKKISKIIFISFAVVVIYTTSSQKLGHKNLFKTPTQQVVSFSPDKPFVEDNSLVLLLHAPTAYLAPLLNKSAVYVGGVRYTTEELRQLNEYMAHLFNPFPEEFYKFHFEKQYRDLLQKHQGPIYAVSFKVSHGGPVIYERLGIKVDPQLCKDFNTNLNPDWLPSYQICRAEKI